VDWRDAVRHWLDTGPSALLVAPVMDWVRGCEATGPPPDAIGTGVEDIYVARVRDTKLVATYFVIEYEFLIIVRDFA
jgi:hypothetical protein